MTLSQWDYHESVRVGLSRQCHSGTITRMLHLDYHDSVTVRLSRPCHSGIIKTMFKWDYLDSVTVGFSRECYGGIIIIVKKGLNKKKRRDIRSRGTGTCANVNETGV